MEEKLKEIFMSIFDLNELDINDDLKAENFDSWDSITHLMIITEIESTFNILIPEELILELSSYKRIKEELIARGIKL